MCVCVCVCHTGFLNLIPFHSFDSVIGNWCMWKSMSAISETFG